MYFRVCLIPRKTEGCGEGGPFSCFSFFAFIFYVLIFVLFYFILYIFLYPWENKLVNLANADFIL